jgi:hypothetical protein
VLYLLAIGKTRTDVKDTGQLGEEQGSQDGGGTETRGDPDSGRHGGPDGADHG